MKITVNGEEKEFDSPATVEKLVKSEVEDGYDRLAVAVNSGVVRKEKWSEIELKAGDEVEIVRPLQGG